MQKNINIITMNFNDFVFYLAFLTNFKFLFLFPSLEMTFEKYLRKHTNILMGRPLYFVGDGWGGCCSFEILI